MSEQRVDIEINFTLHDLTVGDLYPDGDAPDTITKDDVLALIEQDGGAKRILDDWSFGPADVWVVVR